MIANVANIKKWQFGVKGQTQESAVDFLQICIHEVIAGFCGGAVLQKPVSQYSILKIYRGWSLSVINKIPPSKKRGAGEINACLRFH